MQKQIPKPKETFKRKKKGNHETGKDYLAGSFRIRKVPYCPQRTKKTPKYTLTCNENNGKTFIIENNIPLIVEHAKKEPKGKTI